MSNVLMTSLSTRVACLIIIMVIVLPLFDLATYPENDFSMQAWMNSLDLTLTRKEYDLRRRIKEFDYFYTNKGYQPYEVSWVSNGTRQKEPLSGRKPTRKLSRHAVNSDSDAIEAMFNFGEQNKIDALFNIGLILMIIALMVGFSFLLGNAVNVIVLQPLQGLLGSVKQ